MELTTQQLAVYIGRLATADSFPTLIALAADLQNSSAEQNAPVLGRLIARKLERLVREN